MISLCEAKVIKKLRLKERQGIINGENPSPLKKLEGYRNAIAAAKREVRRADRCDPNVCFAIDGGRNLGEKDFQLQLLLVGLISELVNTGRGRDRARYTGVQYGISRKAITRNLVTLGEFCLP